MADVASSPSWWEIVGVSSLIAAGVTAILSLIREYFLERDRFKRQKTIEYLEKQIRLYSQIYYFIEGGRLLGSFDKEKFIDLNEEYKKFNSELMENSHYFERHILKSWYGLFLGHRVLADMKMDSPEFEAQLDKQVNSIKDLRMNVQKILNDQLLPKYRKYAGDSVPDF